MRPAGLAFVSLLFAARLSAQGINAGVDVQLGGPTRMQYSLAWIVPRWTLFEASLGAAWIHEPDADRYGGILDVRIAQDPNRRWYGVASIAGGASSGQAESPWGGWTAGLGWRLITVGSTELSVEGRYQHLWRPDDAFVLGGRIATRWGRKSGGTVPPVPSVPPVSRDSTLPTVSTVAGVSSAARSAVASAVSAMGSPYLWGGTAANGFDCSGLIQYAYLQAGVTLPRRSVEQAKAGQLIPREIDQLVPGDILTFSRDPGGPVSHVGLYVGDRRFIHSATGGVRLSLLSETDPNGRHWMARWVGVRRISPT